MTTGMQSSNTATGIRVNCLYHAFIQKWNAINKQTSLLFNFGKDLNYFVIIRYKLCDFIKIYDHYVNDPTKGDFQKTLLLFHIGRRCFEEYIWLWLHTTSKSLLGLSSMIDNQTVLCSTFHSCVPYK